MTGVKIRIRKNPCHDKFKNTSKKVAPYFEKVFMILVKKSGCFNKRSEQFGDRDNITTLEHDRAFWVLGRLVAGPSIYLGININAL